MFLITCPYCGTRDQSEFAYAHEAHIARPETPEDLSDAEWANFVFLRKNTKGVYAERWMHAAGCRKYFNALRNTATDEFLAFYMIGDTPPDVSVELPATPCGETVGSGNDAAKILRSEDGARSAGEGAQE